MLKRWMLFIVVTVSLLSCLACSNGKDYSSNQNIDESDLFSFSIKTSASPNQVNIIELQEMGRTFEDKRGNEAETYHSFRIYYGEYGSMLEEYIEYVKFDLSNVDYFDVQWADDSSVTINIIRRNDDGSTEKAESIKLDIP